MSVDAVTIRQRHTMPPNRRMLRSVNKSFVSFLKERLHYSSVISLSETRATQTLSDSVPASHAELEKTAVEQNPALQIRFLIAQSDCAGLRGPCPLYSRPTKLHRIG